MCTSRAVNFYRSRALGLMLRFDRMRTDEMWLVSIFSMVCCVLSVWPQFTARILSYGKLAESQGMIDAFQLMGCAGLVLVIIREALSFFF
jgi:hypothetical protein